MSRFIDALHSISPARRALHAPLLAAGLALSPAALPALASSAPAGDLESLRPGDTLRDFRLLYLYEGPTGRADGARFACARHGFLVDVLRIQSVPQAFVWIKTVPDSDRGEPHACEHLLLGKGRRGRYAAALEDMALANSSAFTSQLRTCYHFNTIAGIETFYEICEAKLRALLHPDFSDEEIRREVCHLGVTADPLTGRLSLEEKGTVYTEMVSSFEKPWYHVFDPLEKLVYGPDHPLVRVSGGDPAAMRSMTPEHMRDFHRETHRLDNMGMIVSLPASVDPSAFLGRMREILDGLGEGGGPHPEPAIGFLAHPPARPAPPGSREVVRYPSRNPEDPGYLLLAWPADLDLDPRDRLLLELFLDGFAGGETSWLYRLLLRSDTRRVDIGGEAVWAGVEREAGHMVSIGLSGLRNAVIRGETIDSLRALVGEELRRLGGLPAGDPELESFNAEIRSRLVGSRKRVEHDLDSPPMFGFRGGPAGAWLSRLMDLEEEPGARKPLLPRARYAHAESLLALDGNIWGEALERWRLVTREPYAVGAAPGPEYLDREAEQRSARLAAHLAGMRERFGAADDQAALRAYQAEFDARTREMEAEEAGDPLPRFIADPPLTLDDALDYTTGRLVHGVPYLAALFETMSSSTIVLSLRMDVLPESLLVYPPLLPALLTDIGVLRDGEPVTYDEMRARLRREVLGLSAAYAANPETGRIELELTGRAGGSEEIPRLGGWMEAVLQTPYLRAENLARVIDWIDQRLIGLRNRTKGSEEGWVDDPAEAYRWQTSPLFLATRSFLTQTHLLHRLRWRFSDPGGADDSRALSELLEALAGAPEAADREALAARLAPLADPATPAQASGGSSPRLQAAAAALTPEARALAREIAAGLLAALPEMPAATLSTDWAALCQETRDDLLFDPRRALADLETALSLLRHGPNARLSVVSNSADQEAILAEARRILAAFSPEPLPCVRYASEPRVLERLRRRAPGVEPLYAGLVHEGTRNGVLIFSARIGGSYDTEEEALLRSLAARLFAGGGPHGLFMRTWAAGLAYSNGYGFSERSGRARYYAERCPDVAQTMRFVVETLRDAPPNLELADYAVAQVFGSSRAPSRYEARTAAMAADLADGYTPERVAAYRRAILDQRGRPDLDAQLRARLEAVYGPVLIGFGPPLAESPEGSFFLIGPEEQFRSLEQWIAGAEQPKTIHRLHASDFWLTP